MSPPRGDGAGVLVLLSPAYPFINPTPRSIDDRHGITMVSMEDEATSARTAVSFLSILYLKYNTFIMAVDYEGVYIIS